MTWSVPVVLLKMYLQECDDPEDPNLEEFHNTFPIPGVSGVRRSKTRNKYRHTMGLYKILCGKIIVLISKRCLAA